MMKVVYIPHKSGVENVSDHETIGQIGEILQVHIYKIFQLKQILIKNGAVPWFPDNILQCTALVSTSVETGKRLPGNLC